MTRTEIINKIIEEKGYKTYLEIGTDMDCCLSRIKCNYKVGVDPEPRYYNNENCNVRHLCTSDDFFKINKETFDIIFIDGLHIYEQNKRDLFNALQVLNEGGCIVMHDTNPKLEEHTIDTPQKGIWNGDCYKTIIYIRKNNPELTVRTFKDDYGVSMITKEPSKTLTYVEYNYVWFNNNKKLILNYEG